MAKYVFLLDLKNWINTAYTFYLKFLSSDKSITVVLIIVLNMVKSSLKCLVVCALGLCNTVVYSSVADSILIQELGSKSLQIVYGQPDSARGLIEKALALCAKPENESLAGLTYNYLCIYYDVVGEANSMYTVKWRR